MWNWRCFNLNIQPWMKLDKENAFNINVFLFITLASDWTVIHEKTRLHQKFKFAHNPSSKFLNRYKTDWKKAFFLIPRCNATLLKETRIHACITQKVDFQRHYFLNYRKKLRISASRTHTLDRLFLMNVLNLFLQTGY